MARTQIERANAGGGSSHGSVSGAANWLHLAATPTFALMALLTGAFGGGHADWFCMAAQDAPLLSGMTLMYALMSAFHAGPWLTLIARSRNRMT